MVVFYSINDDNGTWPIIDNGTRRIDVIFNARDNWFINVTLPVEISYWAVPGTLED